MIARANNLPAHPAPRLLLVEDHRDSAEAMAAVMRLWGYDVVVAGSVTAAIASAEDAEREGAAFDGVVCDIGLPDGNGWDLMRLLSSRFDLRGLAVTAYSGHEDVERSGAAGFAEHLVKPVDLGTLARSLERLVAPDPPGTPTATEVEQENL